MLLENSTEATVIGIDRDKQNIDLADENLKDFDKRHISVHRSFEDIEEIMQEYQFPEIHFILYDLWVSSAHYDDFERGFSIRGNWPLDMRFNREHWQTAEEFLQKVSFEDLRDILFKYSDEKKANFISRAIIEARKTQKIDTTDALVSIIHAASFDKKSPLRVFQALRIQVNDEFGHITRSLEAAVKKLAIWWKIAIITFHSIEDRLVKKFFEPYLQDTVDEITGQTTVPAPFIKCFRKPIVPSDDEIATNIRSRSAKLRIYQKIHPLYEC